MAKTVIGSLENQASHSSRDMEQREEEGRTPDWYRKKMIWGTGPIGCPERTQRNDLQEWRPRLHRSGRLKSRLWSFCLCNFLRSLQFFCLLCLGAIFSNTVVIGLSVSEVEELSLELMQNYSVDTVRHQERCTDRENYLIRFWTNPLHLH